MLLFAKYWMHNGFLNIDNKKMSKSLGNFFTVRDIAEKYDLQVLTISSCLAPITEVRLTFSRFIDGSSKERIGENRNCRQQKSGTIMSNGKAGAMSRGRRETVEMMQRYL